MDLTLSQRTRKWIESHLKSGKYGSADEVVAAALSQLDQQEQLADFDPGELDRLLAEGEASGQPLDGHAVFAEVRKLATR